MSRHRWSLRALATAAAVGAVLALAGVAPAQAAAPAAAGTLALTTTNPVPGAELTFSFATTTPSTTDWIGIWNTPSTGPVNQSSGSSSSTDWAYVGSGTQTHGGTAKTSGTVTIPSTSLTSGHDITAYFLAADGYTWLAPPVTFHLGYPTTGTLSLTTASPYAGGDLTFSYSTPTPNATNWIGLYNDPSKGPVNQAYVGGSTSYAYVSASSGTVTIPSTGLTAGHDITAYFLYNDGYQWLAQPVTFQLAAGHPVDASGTLALVTQNPVEGQALQFSYTTNSPNAKNWIGVYADPSQVPSGGKSNGGSTDWNYVNSGTQTAGSTTPASGTISIPSAGLVAGATITAVLLYNDGYQWLAQPVTFQLAPAPIVVQPVVPTTAHFVTDDITEAATHPSDAIRQDASGLWRAADGSAPTSPVAFSKLSGPDWLALSPAGLVTGTAPSQSLAHPALLTVSAVDAAGTTGTLTLEFPLIAPGTTPAFKAVTLNMWDAGSHVADPIEKLAKAVLSNGVDAIGLQSTGGTAATALAAMLGWNVVESPDGEGIVSRYPLAAGATSVPAGVPAVTARVALGNTTVSLWTAGLDPSGYNPTTACTDGASAAIAAEKQTARYRQAQDLAQAMAPDIAAKATVPVVLLADLESPSGLDWTAASSSQHCGAGSVNWPVPAVLKSAGLSDSFRVAQPDPVADPGQTSSVFTGHATPSAQGAAGSELALAAAVAPADERVDYVDYAGALTVKSSHVLVEGFPQSGSASNSWISDRAAVVTNFVFTRPAAPGTGGSGDGAAGTTPGDPGSTTGHHTTSPAGLLAATGIDIAVFGGLIVAALLVAVGAIALARRRTALAAGPAGASDTVSTAQEESEQ